jgi:hypothetical protein
MPLHELGQLGLYRLLQQLPRPCHQDVRPPLTLQTLDLEWRYLVHALLAEVLDHAELPLITLVAGQFESTCSAC